MTDSPPRLYFDFVDPLSFLLDFELEAVDGSETVTWLPFELRPPPMPLAGADEPFWEGRWAAARRLAPLRGVGFEPPRVVPWSRKAHELHAHAASLGCGPRIRRAIFEAFFRQALDIGRVDVLVGLARQEGLDLSGAKAVLDVDRYTDEVVTARIDAVAAGVVTTPLLVAGARRLEGFHNRAAIGTFLTQT